MASSIPVFLLLCAGSFHNTASYKDCYNIINNKLLVCGWLTDKFCCGTCNGTYCCDDPHERITREELDDCFWKDLKALEEKLNFLQPKKITTDKTSVAVYSSLIGVAAFIVVFIICWVSPSCFLHKRFRNPGPVLATTTFVTSQCLPQLDSKCGRYPAYEPLTNDPAHGDQPMPTGPLYGPPPSYPDADGGQTMDAKQPAMPSVCTSLPLALNPVYVELPGTTMTTPVQMPKTED